MVQTPGKTRVMDMTEGSVTKLLFAFALPIFFGNLFQQLYNLADTAIAGHLLGVGALAEIGATSALYSTITGFAFGLNTGFALVVSRFFGAGNERGVRQASGWMVALAAGWALILTVGFLVFRYPLLRFLQTPENVMEGALSYITVILAGIPLTMAYNLESGLLRSVGNSKTPLYFLMFSCGLNVVLDYLFMGPFQMGVRGAAVATVMAQGISAAMGLFYILRHYKQMRFSIQDLKDASGLSGEMFLTGFSMAMMSTIYSIGSVILQGSINALGSTYIAAQVGGRRLVELFMMPGGALSASSATFASQNFGAGKRSRIWKGVKAAFFMYLGWWLVAMVFTVFFAPQAVKIVTGSASQEVIENAVLYIRVSIPLFPPMGFLIIMRNVLQGMCHRIAPLFCSSLELIGKVIFGYWIVPVVGYPAVCACEPVTWIACFLFMAVAAIVWKNEFQDKPERASVS